MKTTKLFLLAALALTTGACSNDDSIIESPATEAVKAGGITITATLAAKDGAVTRALSAGADGIKATWAVDEKMAVLYEVNGTKTAAEATITKVDDESGAATIEFTVDEGTTDGTACTLVYPASAAKDDHTGVKDAATLLAAQDGTLSASRDVCVGEGTIQVTNPGLEVTTQPAAQFSISKFAVKNGTADLAVKDLTITIGEQQYVITPAQATSELYATLPTVSNGTVSFSATGSDDKTYTSSKENVTIEQGKYYQGDLTLAAPVTYTLLSAATTGDQGKVVCADGHLHDAKTAVPSGCTAVGILGKVTTTGHGLILSLQNAAQQAWNTINGWEPVTAYANTTLKLLPDDAARGTDLTSYTTLGSTTVSNWAVAQKSDYEAIFTNLGSMTGNTDGKTYDDNVNAYITTGVGGTAIFGVYLSATGNGVDYAWVFLGNVWTNALKDYTYSVRPVLGF